MYHFLSFNSTNIAVKLPFQCATLRVWGYKQLLVVCNRVIHETVLGPRWFYIMSTIVNLQLTATTVTVSMWMVWVFRLLQSCSGGLCPSWMCHHITGQLVPDVSSQCDGLIVKDQAAHNSCLAALPLKIKALCSFETSETTHSITQHHIPEDLNFHG